MKNIAIFSARTSKVFLISVFVFLLSFSQIDAKKYYVNNTSENASDTNPGSFDHPWATIHKANKFVTAGDTVIVMAGVYHDWIAPYASGAEGNWIVYKSEPEYAAVLDGLVELSEAADSNATWLRDNNYPGNVWKYQLISNAFCEAWKDGERMPFPFPYPCDTLEFAEGRSFIDSAGVLRVWLGDNENPNNHQWQVTLKSGVWLLANYGEREKYLIVEGFTVKNYGLSGINVQKNYVKILNNKAYSNGRSGIGVDFCNYVWVVGNEAYENCKGIGFSQGITAYGATGHQIYFIGNISHNNFDGADSLHCGTDGAGFSLDTSEPNGGAVFMNNVVYGNRGNGFNIFKSNYGYFINNTSFNNGKKSIFGTEFFIRTFGEGTANNIIVRNNIFAGKYKHPHIWTISYPYSHPPENVLIDHNLYYLPYAAADSAIFEITVTSGMEDSVYHLNLEELKNFEFPRATGDIPLNWGDSSIVASPELIDWRNGGFKLSASSPAIDNGNGSFAPTTDFYGTHRPQGKGFDIGAYEFVNESGIKENVNPLHFDLSIYPNPFNGQIKINYSLPRKTTVQLMIFDILGRKVMNLINKNEEKGKHSVSWNAHNSANDGIASGIYFVLLKTDYSLLTKKIIYLK
jgi:hypothetical protein